MNRKKYMSNEVFDIPRVPENEFLFESVISDAEERVLEVLADAEEDEK